MVLEALDGLPLTVTTGTTSSSVVAVLDGDEPGPTVLLRGDMDALPMHEDTGLEFASRDDGAMHACGHDTHVAMLAGAAKLLAARRGGLRGRVAFMFQPGEEGHHGARFMLEDGLLATAADGAEPVSMAFAIHQTPDHPVRDGRQPRARRCWRRPTSSRSPCGAGVATPPCPTTPATRSPSPARSSTALQAMVTRRVDAFDPAVVTVAKIRAGSTTNVIPETATLWGTIRTVSESTRAAVMADIERLATGIASAHGATAEVELTHGYPVTVNHDDAAAFALETAGLLLGEAAAIEMPTPVMGAEDWSYVLQEVNGAMAFLGTRPPGVAPHDVAPNHSNRMVLDEDAMAAGIATYAGVALRWLAR